MKKIKVILSVLLMAAAISFTACSNASSGSDSEKTEKEDDKKTETPKPASGNGSGSGSGSGTNPAPTYIGTKAPSVAKAVGDVVFSDGSATPYTAGKRFNDTQKNAAVAIIFYVGDGLNSGNSTGTSRTLGLGLKNKAGIKWCANDANACSNGIDSIKCTPISNNGVYFYDGDLNGSDNFKQLSDALETMNGVDDDTTTEGNYPPFEYAENYSSTATNLNSFNTKWFLPSIAELYQIYSCNKDKNNGFDINAALESLGGNKFEEVKFWSASQTEEAGKAYTLDFKTGELVEESKTYIAGYACAIRDFTNYTVTLLSTDQVTISADKETATAGEKVTLTYTPAAPDDYDVTFNGFTVLNGSKAVKVEADNSFIMPAGNVNVSADIDYENLYKITISSGTGGSVTASKTKGIKAGDEITLTVTPLKDENNNYKLKSLTVKNGDTPVTVTNNSFTMPAGNVTITAVFEIKYIGSNNPSVAKKVGDIVFNDGSSMPYSEFESLDPDEQADLKTSAIALIFYTGTGLNSDKADGTPDTSKSRTLGVGLKIGREKWCLSNAKAYDKIITTIQCTKTGKDHPFTITGDKNGSDNFTQIGSFLGEQNDTDNVDNYPIFKSAMNYSTKVTNLGNFNTNWYIPSIAELYQIYYNGCLDGSRSFDINEVIEALGGDRLDHKTLFSSSQAGDAKKAYFETFYTDQNGKISDWDKNHDNPPFICYIREFN